MNKPISTFGLNLEQEEEEFLQSLQTIDFAYEDSPPPKDYTDQTEFNQHLCQCGSLFNSADELQRHLKFLHRVNDLHRAADPFEVYGNIFPPSSTNEEDYLLKQPDLPLDSSSLLLDPMTIPKNRYSLPESDDDFDQNLFTFQQLSQQKIIILENIANPQPSRRYNNSNKTHECPTCRRRYSTPYTLQSHIKRKHPTQHTPLPQPYSLEHLSSTSTEPLADSANRKPVDFQLPQDSKKSEQSLFPHQPVQFLESDSSPAREVPSGPPQPKLDASGNKIFITKRIYFCGGCLSRFKFNQELTIHLEKEHPNDIPDGTIYGLKQELLYRTLHIPYTRPGPYRQPGKFRCGCGKPYACSSSLRGHIKGAHNGIRPAGTIGAVPRKPTTQPGMFDQ